MPTTLPTMPVAANSLTTSAVGVPVFWWLVSAASPADSAAASALASTISRAGRMGAAARTVGIGVFPGLAWSRMLATAACEQISPGAGRPQPVTLRAQARWACRSEPKPAATSTSR